MGIKNNTKNYYMKDTNKEFNPDNEKHVDQLSRGSDPKRFSEEGTFPLFSVSAIKGQ